MLVYEEGALANRNEWYWDHGWEYLVVIGTWFQGLSPGGCGAVEGEIEADYRNGEGEAYIVHAR